jgi:hypothetical protein
VSLLRPDPFADLAPLKKRVVEKLMKGEFVPIGELLRTQLVAPTTATRHVGSIGGIQLSIDSDANAAANLIKRSVTQPLDWLEAFSSSILPAQALAIQQLASAVQESHVAANLSLQAERMRQLVGHLCAAISYFQRHGKLGNYANVVGFLETQRRNWHNKQIADLAVPEQTAFMLMSTAAAHSNAPSAFSSGHNVPSASEQAQQVLAAQVARAAKNPPPNTPGKKYCKGVEICKSYQNDKCRYGTCRFAHVCMDCHTPGLTQYHAGCTKRPK